LVDHIRIKAYACEVAARFVQGAAGRTALGELEVGLEALLGLEAPWLCGVAPESKVERLRRQSKAPQKLEHET